MIVLDTHIWIWWLALDQTSVEQRWRDAISNADALAVSAISCVEVAWLVTRKRIEISVPLDAWFDAVLGGSGVRLLPITPLVARIAAELPLHHRDPHDWILIATAVASDAQIVSADGRFPAYEELGGRLIA